jgi:hypothetical protein
MAPDRPCARGFILATTLLVMTLLTVMLTAAFIMVSAEFRSTGSSFSLARSLNLAQAGLTSYFASTHSLLTPYDSTNYTFPGGFARVVARRLRDTTSTARELWIVYATGVDTTRSLLSVGGGSRAVASLAYRLGQLPARAAMVAANGISVTASPLGTVTNPLSGENASIGDAWVIGCTEPVSPAADTAAATTAPPGYSQSTGNNPTGTVQTLATYTAVADSTLINWARVVAGELYPDYLNTLPTPCPATLPWGDSDHCPYSSYLWNGSVTVPSAGSGASRGLLIATGDVTMGYGSHWDGIIIAGGRFLADTSNYFVHGMVISGLNCATSSCPLKNSIRRGGTIRWDWCYAHAALSGFASLAPIRGTFMDNWKTY